MRFSREKVTTLLALSTPFTLLAAGAFCRHQEVQELRNAPNIGLSDLPKLAPELKDRSVRIELNGESTSLGEASQKIHTTYFSSGGSPTIEGERSVFLYRLSDGNSNSTLLASETELPSGQVSVKGKLHSTSQHFTGNISDSPIFLQVELCKSGLNEIACAKSISTVP